MTRSPIPTVLSSLVENHVKCLLMGGQACILYGAAEFSRDADFAIHADAENLHQLRLALDSLKAQVVAVPPFEIEFLDKGHAVHFRCGRSDVQRFRIDVMSRMRGVDPFEDLWARRTTATLEHGLVVDLLGLPDLVNTKKTQREKDWPMITRLVAVDFLLNRSERTPERARFWLTELRSANLLVECCRDHAAPAERLVPTRDAIAPALRGDEVMVQDALDLEKSREMALDREYWQPLRAELEALRESRTKRERE